MQIETIKIYGERNSGTNYLTDLFRTNLNVKILAGVVPHSVGRAQRILPGREWLRDIYFHRTFDTNLGWKHSLVSLRQLLAAGVATRGLGFVTITKNPYSWLLSMYRRPYHQHYNSKHSFEEFLQLPWHTVGRENSPSSPPSPVHLWNLKNKAYVSLKESLPSYLLRYEDLLAQPQTIVETTADLFGLQRKQQEFVNVISSTKQDGKTFSYYQTYYLKERWREKLTLRAIELINDALDTSVMDYFGYKKIAG